MKKLWLVILVLFVIAFVYLWEHSTTVTLTFRAYKEGEELKKISERVEMLRVKSVELSSAKRIYKIVESNQ